MLINHGTDQAKKPGLSLDELNRFLEDMQTQPSWRINADIDAEYYDSNQLTPQQVAELQTRGIPPIVVNLIAPAINMVLGMEAKTRTDWVVRPEADEQMDMASAMSQKLSEAERKTRADHACAEAYAKQIKAGLGWVEVSREHDPFKYPYRCKPVDRREIWWDWRSKEADLSDARYLVRRKWHDVDYLCALLPEFKELIQHSINQWSGFDPQMLENSPYLVGSSEVERDWGWHDAEWRDPIRKRACLYEVWYRIYIRGHVLKLPDGRVVEFDRKNPMHRVAVASGKIKPQAATFPKMRQSWWVGPHRLYDRPTPYKHQNFPYVPFWGFREDMTGAPYGLIRSMRPLQDEVNRRRHKMLWQLSAVRVIMDDDAVKDKDSLAREIARPDAMIVQNKDRKNVNGGVKVEEHQGLTSQQFQVYEESKQTLQDAAGVYNAQLGKDMTGQSGIAINSLVEQGTTTLAEINDNFRMARSQVGEMLLSLIIEDMAETPTTVKVKGRLGQHGKTVELNKPVTDPDTGIQYRDNDVTRARLNVELDDMPSTPTFRTQMFLQMLETVKGLPPDMQAMMIDMVIEASDFPYKDEMAARLRKHLGIVPEDPDVMSDEEKQQLEQRMKAEQEAAAKQQRAEELALETAAAELEKIEADTEKTRAETAEALADAEKTRAETGTAAEDAGWEVATPASRAPGEATAGGVNHPTLAPEEMEAIGDEMAASANPPVDDSRVGLPPRR